MRRQIHVSKCLRTTITDLICRFCDSALTSTHSVCVNSPGIFHILLREYVSRSVLLTRHAARLLTLTLARVTFKLFAAYTLLIRYLETVSAALASTTVTLALHATEYGLPVGRGLPAVFHAERMLQCSTAILNDINIAYDFRTPGSDGSVGQNFPLAARLRASDAEVKRFQAWLPELVRQFD